MFGCSCKLLEKCFVVFFLVVEKEMNGFVFVFLVEFVIRFQMLNYSFSESSDEMEDRLDKPTFCGPLTIDVVENNRYQPITIFDKFKLSNMIWATPMNTFLPSIRP